MTIERDIDTHEFDLDYGIAAEGRTWIQTDANRERLASYLERIANGIRNNLISAQ